MMLKVNDRYLDFDADLEIERQVKLFEELDSTRGDFSYQSTLPPTHNNFDALGLPYPDNNTKHVYNFIDCDLLSNSGELVHKGYIRVENISKSGIKFRFFSGNSSWMNLLEGNMTELSLDQYDQAVTTSNIITRFTATDGITFPVADFGSITKRSSNHLVPQDFTGCFYLHTLFKETMRQSGLKIAGELLSDPLYNRIVIATNTRSKQDEVNHNLYVGKSGTQSTSTSDKIDFDLQSTPFYVGGDITFGSNNDFEPSATMIADIEVYAESSAGDGVVKLRQERIVSPLFKTVQSCLISVGDPGSINLKSVKLYSGYRYYLEFNPTNGSGSVTLTNACTWRITPKYIYKAFGKSAVPLWTKKEFVSNILSLFNTITDYDPFSKTVTINLFKNIKSKTPVDLSAYISEVETDYTEFISNYGKSSTLSYTESSEPDLSEYNISSFLKYGAGVIEVDNDYIPKDASIVDLDFAAPLSYINAGLNCSVEKMQFIELTENETIELTSVTDNSGTARFNILFDDIIIGDMVEINSTVSAYNGQWMVVSLDTTASTWIEVYNMDYQEEDDDGDPVGTVTGEIKVLRHRLTTDDSCYLLINIPNVAVTDISSYSNIRISSTNTSNVSLGFFALINTGKNVNDDYKQSLAFGTPTGSGFYQRTMIQTYWREVANVLNDPVKQICTAQLPETIYRQLTPLTPVYLKTQETTNLYYINRIRGYKGQHQPCTIELIKLP